MRMDFFEESGKSTTPAFSGLFSTAGYEETTVSGNMTTVLSTLVAFISVLSIILFTVD